VLYALYTRTIRAHSHRPKSKLVARTPRAGAEIRSVAFLQHIGFIGEINFFATFGKYMLTPCFPFGKVQSSNRIVGIESQQKRRQALHTEPTQINVWHLDP